MLIITLILAIIFIVIATSKYHVHPFVVLLLAAYGISFAVGFDSASIASHISKGFGGILSYIGVVIVLGTIIGVILEKSGAAITMANTVLRVVGEKRPVLAMSIIGYIVSIPVFCDSGFVILNSLKNSLINKLKVSNIAMSVALATGLFATHTLVPPTPGPIAAAGNLHVDNLGSVIVIGVCVSLVAMLAGYFYAQYAGAKWDTLSVPDLSKDEEVQKKYGKLPSVWNAFAPIFVPIVLMALASVVKFLAADVPVGVSASSLLADPSTAKIFMFLGTPTNALLVGLLFALPLLPSFDAKYVNGWIGEGVKNSGEILVITGAGGALGAVLKASGIGDLIGASLQGMQMGILVPFIIAAALKTAQGSSTTALVVTSTIIYPLLSSLGLDSEEGKILTVMAIGAGAMTISHANDSFFWVVSRFSNLEVGTAYKSFSAATLIQGLVSIVLIAILSMIML